MGERYVALEEADPLACRKLESGNVLAVVLEFCGLLESAPLGSIVGSLTSGCTSGKSLGE